MTTELFWKEVDVLWEKAEAVWAQADRIFANMKSQPKMPEAEVTRHKMRFHAATRRDRCRTAWKFVKMAGSVIWHGQAELKFKGHEKD